MNPVDPHQRPLPNLDDGGVPPRAGGPAAPVPAAGRRTGRARYAVAGVAALALVGAGAGIGYATGGSGSASVGSGTATSPGTSNDMLRQGPNAPAAGDGSGDTGSRRTGSGSSKSGSTAGGATAIAVQAVGVVDVDTTLAYQGARAAGTGMVIRSDGMILTNNHVVDGATAITVTVVSTGQTYSAAVVGTDATDDVAVLKVTASGLTTVTTVTTSNVAVGDSVTAVGNAGGTGGTPSAAPGSVTATDQSITATDEQGADPERLTGLIETDARIEPGDSGGPLVNSADQVVGMDTAAQTTTRGTTTAGYAIPIASALTIAEQIVAGDGSGAVTIGLPAFLGVSIDASSNGALVAGVLADGAAAQVGIAAGATITAVGTTAVEAATDLSAALAHLHPGQQVNVSWTDATGAEHSATVTLGTGPAS